MSICVAWKMYIVTNFLFSFTWLSSLFSLSSISSVLHAFSFPSMSFPSQDITAKAPVAALHVALVSSPIRRTQKTAVTVASRPAILVRIFITPITLHRCDDLRIETGSIAKKVLRFKMTFVCVCMLEFNMEVVEECKTTSDVKCRCQDGFTCKEHDQYTGHCKHCHPITSPPPSQVYTSRVYKSYTNWVYTSTATTLFPRTQKPTNWTGKCFCLPSTCLDVCTLQFSLQYLGPHPSKGVWLFDSGLVYRSGVSLIKLCVHFIL